MARKRQTPTRPTEAELLLWWPWIVRFTGLGVFLYEVVGQSVERPSILVLVAAMIGLPELITLGRSSATKDQTSARQRTRK